MHDFSKSFTYKCYCWSFRRRQVKTSSDIIRLKSYIVLFLKDRLYSSYYKCASERIRQFGTGRIKQMRNVWFHTEISDIPFFCYFPDVFSRWEAIEVLMRSLLCLLVCVWDVLCLRSTCSCSQRCVGHRGPLGFKPAFLCIFQQITSEERTNRNPALNTRERDCFLKIEINLTSWYY